MSLPRQLNISSRELQQAESVEDLKKFLGRFIDEWQLIYQKTRKEMEAYAWRTNTWRGYEDSSGDLVIEKWDGSAWQNAQTIAGS